MRNRRPQRHEDMTFGPPRSAVHEAHLFKKEKRPAGIDPAGALKRLFEKRLSEKAASR
jgi:hypothetical protein